MVVLAVFLAAGGAIWYVGFHDKGMSKTFDASALAEAELRMWQVYYGGEPDTAIGVQLLKLLREQFGLSLKTGYAVAEELARATIVFRGTKTGYDTEVLPHLVLAYTILHNAVDGTWDPAEVARAELEWWVLRRQPEGDRPEAVGAAIAREYTLLYGASNEHIDRAGLLRAQAADLRDQGRRNADWDKIGQLLRDSYGELVLGVAQ